MSRIVYAVSLVALAPLFLLAALASMLGSFCHWLADAIFAIPLPAWLSRE